MAENQKEKVLRELRAKVMTGVGMDGGFGKDPVVTLSKEELMSFVVHEDVTIRYAAAFGLCVAGGTFENMKTVSEEVSPLMKSSELASPVKAGFYRALEVVRFPRTEEGKKDLVDMLVDGAKDENYASEVYSVLQKVKGFYRGDLPQELIRGFFNSPDMRLKSEAIENPKLMLKSANMDDLLELNDEYVERAVISRSDVELSRRASFLISQTHSPDNLVLALGRDDFIPSPNLVASLESPSSSWTVARDSVRRAWENRQASVAGCDTVIVSNKVDEIRERMEAGSTQEASMLIEQLQRDLRRRPAPRR